MRIFKAAHTPTHTHTQTECICKSTADSHIFLVLSISSASLVLKADYHGVLCAADTDVCLGFVSAHTHARRETGREREREVCSFSCEPLQKISPHLLLSPPPHLASIIPVFFFFFRSNSDDSEKQSWQVEPGIRSTVRRLFRSSLLLWRADRWYGLVRPARSLTACARCR